MKLRVKKGDVVTVIAGKNKGTTGKILATQPDKGSVIVEGVNIATIHQKARKQGEKSTIVKVEKAIDASNVMINCPDCKKPVKVAIKEIDGKKVRVCKKCGHVFETEKVVIEKKTAEKAPKTTKAKTTKAKKETKTETVETEKKPTTRRKKATTEEVKD